MSKEVHMMWDDAVLTVAPSNSKLEKFLTYKEKTLEKDPNNPWKLVPRVKTVPLFKVINKQGNYNVIQTMQGLWLKVKTFLEQDGYTVKFYDMRIKFPEPRLDLMSGFRFSQKELVNKFLGTKCSGLLSACTRYGKTTIIKNTIRAFPNVTTIVTAPGADLIKQLYEDIKEACPGRETVLIGAGSARKHSCDDINVVSMDSLHKCDPDKARLLLVDECFTPDVEVLTDKGFIRFDAATAESKYAQVDMADLKLDFTKADNVIVKPYNGNLITLKADKRCDVSMTPGHELVIKQNNVFSKIAISDAKFSYDKKFITAARGAGIGACVLTVFERLMIATQADGNIHHVSKDGRTSVSFSFRKQRKIDRLLYLVSMANLSCNEVKTKPKDRRFIVTGLPYASKILSDTFKLDELTYQKAEAIVKEAMEWDGHKHSSTSWYYSSTIKENVDFMQCVCVLAGYKSNLTIQCDARSYKFSDVYRLFIHTDTNEVSTQKINKIEEPYNGNVYCVRVPKGNIVVRRNGKPLIIGNCHACVTDSRLPELSKFDKARKFGFGATLTGRYDQRDILIEALIGPVLAERTFKEAVAEGAVCPMLVYMIIIPVNQVYADRNLAYKKLLFENERVGKAVKWICHELLPKDWQSLIFIKNEKQAEFFLDWVGEAGTIAMAKRLTKKEREELMTRMCSDEIKRCLASDIYSQGVTFNHVRALINLSGGGASTSTIQKPGRLAEVRPNKKCGVVFDFMFVPSSDKNLQGSAALVRESMARSKAYIEKGYEVIYVDSYDTLEQSFKDKAI